MAAKKQAVKRAAPAKAATKAGARKAAPAKTQAKQAAPGKQAAKRAAPAKKQAKQTAPGKQQAKQAAPAKQPAAPGKKPAKRTAPGKQAVPGKKQAKRAAPAKQAAPGKQQAKQAASARPAARAKDWLVGPLASLRALGEAVVDLGVSVVSDAESRAGGKALRDGYAGGWSLGVLWSPPLWDACRARVRKLRLWGRGQAMRGALGSEVTPSFFVDPADPGQLWYAPTTALPAALFVPLPATRAAIEQALAELGPGATRPGLGEATVVRAYMGAVAILGVPSPYSGQLERAGPHELDRHFNFSPVVTAHGWGSAFADDPLLDRTSMSTLESVVALREMREQVEGGLPRFTRRAYFSGAQVAIEMHARGHYVWEIEYRPSRFTEGLMASFNALTEQHYPLDLPVDVAAAIHGFLFLDGGWLDARIAAETDLGQRGALVSAALAVAADDVAEAARIGRAALARDEVDQVEVANAAMQYNWPFLLEELGVVTRDEALRAQIEAVLIQGLGPPQLSEHGEPIDVYDGAGDDDEDDEDDEDDDEEEGDDA